MSLGPIGWGLLFRLASLFSLFVVRSHRRHGIPECVLFSSNPFPFNAFRLIQFALLRRSGHVRDVLSAFLSFRVQFDFVRFPRRVQFRPVRW